ncbi:MAG TPA: alpha/beta fold hydrolase [Acidimicrobiales bacterium]|nr:alpha/beta fold hydrolase [Acidimicrobiales bacterium]
MRLVLVHGFTQSPASWDGVRRHLEGAVEGGLEVVTPEVPDGLDFAATARAVAEGGGAAVYGGYSMGGRICLRAALERPDLVRGLVLVSASPGLADGDARARRRQRDTELAGEIGRLGVPAFVRRWLAQPLFSTLQAGEDEVDRRAEATTVERLVHQLVVLGQGVQEPLWDRLDELAVPVAVMSGRADAAYDAIGDAMAAAVADCVRVRVEGGHALPLEQPAAVAGALLDVVRRVARHEPTP